MIHLAPTKALVYEERDHTVVPRPRRLLKPIQFFEEFAHKVFIPLLYKPFREIHVDIHLQYPIQKRCFYIHLVDLPIHGYSYYENGSNGDKVGHGSKVLLKSILSS